MLDWIRANPHTAWGLVLTVPTVVAFLIMRGEVSRWVVFGYLGALVVGLAAIQFAL